MLPCRFHGIQVCRSKVIISDDLLDGRSAHLGVVVDECRGGSSSATIGMDNDSFFLVITLDLIQRRLIRPEIGGKDCTPVTQAVSVH